MRAVLLVACLIACFPRLWLLGMAWLTAVSIMLVFGGWHTPSDVAGGFAIATRPGRADLCQPLSILG
jgi:hypothetical protein